MVFVWGGGWYNGWVGLLLRMNVLWSLIKYKDRKTFAWVEGGNTCKQNRKMNVLNCYCFYFVKMKD